MLATAARPFVLPSCSQGATGCRTSSYALKKLSAPARHALGGTDRGWLVLPLLPPPAATRHTALALVHSIKAFLLLNLPLVQVHVQQPGGYAPQVGDGQPHQPQSERFRRFAGKRGCAGGPAASVFWSSAGGTDALRCLVSQQLQARLQARGLLQSFAVSTMHVAPLLHHCC